MRVPCVRACRVRVLRGCAACACLAIVASCDHAMCAVVHIAVNSVSITLISGPTSRYIVDAEFKFVAANCLIQ